MLVPENIRGKADIVVFLDYRPKRVGSASLQPKLLHNLQFVSTSIKRSFSLQLPGELGLTAKVNNECINLFGLLEPMANDPA